jgi:hypothetical protein
MSADVSIAGRSGSEAPQPRPQEDYDAMRRRRRDRNDLGFSPGAMMWGR